MKERMNTPVRARAHTQAVVTGAPKQARLDVRSAGRRKRRRGCPAAKRDQGNGLQKQPLRLRKGDRGHPKGHAERDSARLFPERQGRGKRHNRKAMHLFFFPKGKIHRLAIIPSRCR